ncbi:MAG: helix-turn-helix transcriptional regulator [Bryobacteraceae bacterium]|nr:helix-turn-helix transcriptional regulator [Bryobacteraceae bacterium]
MARRLKEAREYLELPQEEVAKELGVPRTAISLMESGQRKVEALELQKLARLFQRPVGYFTGDEAAESSLPPQVAHLARAASKLSNRDRDELARFAEYLQSRSLSEKE